MHEPDQISTRAARAGAQDAGDPASTAGSGGARVLYLDAVRSVALARVLLYHALQQDWPLVFSSMPLMFFVSGSLFATSLERRAATSVVESRYRRILPSYWFYVAAMMVLWASLGVLGQLSWFDWISFAFPVISLGGPQGPGVGTDLSLTWGLLWYLQMHLILALVGPLLRRLQQRRPLLLWSGLAILALPVWLTGTPAVLAFLFVASWILGYHHHDGHLREVLRRFWWAIALGCFAVVGVLVVTTSGSDGTTSAIRAATLLVGLLGIFWLIVAVRVQPIVEPWLRGRRVRSTLTWSSRRSLTIYLWHIVPIYAALAIPLPGSSWWAGRIAWCLLGTVVAVVAFGWIEDLAARRPISLWPTAPRVASPTGRRRFRRSAPIDLREGRGPRRPSS